MARHKSGMCAASCATMTWWVTLQLDSVCHTCFPYGINVLTRFLYHACYYLHAFRIPFSNGVFPVQLDDYDARPTTSNSSPMPDFRVSSPRGRPYPSMNTAQQAYGKQTMYEISSVDSSGPAQQSIGAGSQAPDTGLVDYADILDGDLRVCVITTKAELPPDDSEHLGRTVAVDELAEGHACFKVGS